MSGARLGLGAVLGVIAVATSIAVASVVWGSDDRFDPSSSSTSASIVVVGDDLWVTSPDDGSVAVIDRDTLDRRDAVAVGGAPVELSRVGSTTVVTNRATSDLSLITDTGAVDTLAIPCGGSHGVAALPGTASSAVVTCPFDARLVVVDVAAPLVVGWVGLGGRPAGVTATADRITIAGDSDGHLWSLDPSLLPDDAGGGRIDVEVSTERVWSRPDRAATMLRSVVAIGPGDVAATYQMVDNDSERPEGSDGSYGSIVDGDPRIEPLVSGPCGSRFAHFDRSDRELAGPVALAWDADAERLWVVGRFTGTVAVLDCSDSGDPGSEVEMVASFRVGEGARGIALAPDGGTAYVDVGFDHSVAELVVDPDAPGFGVEPQRVVRRPTGDLSLTSDALAGRRIFNDGRDRHLTPSGVATCASCHLDGGDDGVTWRISTDDIPTKVRRTPPLWSLGAGTKPLHWDGGFDSASRLSSDTIRNLLGGDGLLVDTANVAAYMAEIDPPPPAPDADPVGVESGRDVFDLACVHCHADESGSDGSAHDLGRPSSDPDASMTEVVTPTLFGTRARAPYFHDGSADSLDAALSDDAHGGLPSLSEEDRRDLVAYLSTR